MAPKRERTVSPPTTTTINKTNNINSIHSPISSSPIKLSSSSSPPTASTSNLNQKSLQQSPQELARSPTSTPPKQLNNSNSSIITDNNKSTATSTTTSPRNSPTTNTTSLPSTTPPRTNVNSSPSSTTSSTNSSNSNSSSPSSNNNNKSNSSPTARRVKLYRLHEDQWIDLGTGSCVGNFIESSSDNNNGNQQQQQLQQQHEESEGAYIVVTKEPETGKPSEIILRSKIQPYPSGYLSDEDDEEELGNGGGGGNGNNKVLDQGGYQRQQETLIVWTDKETDIEMALSFATTAGCTEIWEFIKAARKWSEHTVASPSISSPSSPPQPFPLYSLTKLPEPSLGNIEQVELSIRSIGRTAAGRERTAITIIKGNYIQKLIKIQEEAEDLESLEDLHALCRVMQTILLLNDNVIFDLILRDEIVLGVASILEYDPEFPTMKASYRSHLSDLSQFTEIIPIRSPTLLAKIHQTHRLHYFKDVVLARILEDSTFSMLNSAIYFNEVDIVNEVASDTVFLKALFAIFDEEEEEEEGAQEQKEDVSKGEGKEGLIGPSLPVIESSIGPQLPAHSIQTSTEDKMDVDDPTTSSHFVTKQPTSPTGSIINLTSPTTNLTTTSNPSPPIRDRKHDAILFLQQFSSMAKNLQLPARAAFFRNLADKGLLRVIEVALSRTITLQDPQMRGATIEILMMLVDHDPNNVRGYSLKQHGLGKRPLVVFLIELFHTELDLGLKAQMSEALRVLVDAGGNGGPLEAPPRLRPEDPEAEKFLQYFYDHCILSLLAPILALPEQSSTDPPLDLPPHSVALSAHLCDLLCFFVSHHTFRSKYFVLSTSISTNVAKLFRARPKHLRLAALRYFRACVGKNDDFYNRFLIKNSLLDPILDMSLEERGRDNLLSSACLEFFEYVRSINAKALINHLMERKGDTIRALSKEGLITFGSLIVKWEQNNEPPPSAIVKPAEDASTATPTSKGMSRDRGGNWTRMDTEEEESYFNGSDEEDDSFSTTASTSTTPSKKREGDPTENLSAGKKVKLDGSTTTGSTLPGGGSLSRSQTWPSDTSKGKGKSLVEYGDDDEEEEDGDIGPGGFIREKSDPLSTTEDLDLIPNATSNTDTSSSDSTTSNLDRHTREAAPPPPSPSESDFPLSNSLSSPDSSTNGIKPLPLLPFEESESTLSINPSTSTSASIPIATEIEIESGPPELTPGELRRRNEAEEEDADSNGFLKLSSKGKKPLLAGGGTPAKSVLFGTSILKSGNSAVSTPTSSSSTTNSNPIKISFGGFGKLLGGGLKEKEVESDTEKDKETVTVSQEK